MHIPVPHVESYASLRRGARRLALSAWGLLALGAGGGPGAQEIEAAPATGEAGAVVRVTVRTERGEPLAGIPVRAHPPSGAVIELGRTDPSGSVSFTAPAPGRYELRAEVPDGPALAMAYEVRPERRWAVAIVWVPVGLVLLWWNLRRWRRGAAS